MLGSYNSMWAELRSSEKSQRGYFQSQDVTVWCGQRPQYLTIHTSVRVRVVVVVVLVVVVVISKIKYFDAEGYQN